MIGEIFEWLGNMENSKPLALILFFAAFVGIVVYVYSGKKRKDRLESYKDIPFQEDDALDPTKPKKRQVNNDESNR